MTPSEKFTNFIISYEAEVLHGYLDSVNKLTVGIGHLVLPGEPYKLNQKITLEESRRLFAQDVNIAADAVKGLVKVELNQNQLEALVSFVFNLGKGNLASSTLLKKLNAGDYVGASKEFGKWTKAGGKVAKGLVRRRAAEAEMFMS